MYVGRAEEAQDMAIGAGDSDAGRQQGVVIIRIVDTSLDR